MLRPTTVSATRLGDYEITSDTYNEAVAELHLKPLAVSAGCKGRSSNCLSEGVSCSFVHNNGR